MEIIHCKIRLLLFWLNNLTHLFFSVLAVFLIIFLKLAI